MHRKNNGDPILRSNPRYLFAFPLSGVLSRVALPSFGLLLSRIPRPLLTFFLSCFPDRLRGPFLPYVFPGPTPRSVSSLCIFRAVSAFRLFLNVFSGPPSRPVSSFVSSGPLSQTASSLCALRADFAGRLFFMCSPGRLRAPYSLSRPPRPNPLCMVCGPVSTIINPAPPVNANPRFSSHSQRARPRLPAQKRIYFCHFE